MARPAVTGATEAVYARLPAHYADADARQVSGGGYPLLRWLSGLGDQLAEVDAILARLDYRTLSEGRVGAGTSDLLDPLTADVSWLAWLGWLVGVDASTRLTDAERRAAIAGISSGGWAAGSQESLAAAVRPLLSGTKLVRIFPGEYGPWTVGVHTRLSETSVLTWDSIEATFRDWGELEASGSWDGLSPRDPLAALLRANVIPAGVTVTAVLGVSTWDSLAAGAPDWAAWEAAVSWAVLEDV